MHVDSLIDFENVAPGIHVRRPPSEERRANAWLVDDELLIEPTAASMPELEAWAEWGRGRRLVIFLTHWHGDHSQLTRRIAQQLGMVAVGLRGNEMPSTVLGWQVLKTPGHAAEHVCLYRDGVLIGGDVLYENGAAALVPASGCDDYRRTCAMLARLSIDVVLPGHGPMIRKPQKFFETAA